jgi:hypothetical protein
MILKHFFYKFEIAVKTSVLQNQMVQVLSVAMYSERHQSRARASVGTDVMLLFYRTRPLVSGLQMVELRPYFSQIFLNTYFLSCENYQIQKYKLDFDFIRIHYCSRSEAGRPGVFKLGIAIIKMIKMASSTSVAPNFTTSMAIYGCSQGLHLTMRLVQ